MSTVVSTRLTDDEIAKLDRLAAASGVSRACILKLLVTAVDTITMPVIVPARVTWEKPANS